MMTKHKRGQQANNKPVALSFNTLLKAPLFN